MDYTVIWGGQNLHVEVMGMSSFGRCMELRKLMTAVGDVPLAPYAVKLGQSWSEETVKRCLAFDGAGHFLEREGILRRFSHHEGTIFHNTHASIDRQLRIHQLWG